MSTDIHDPNDACRTLVHPYDLVYAVLVKYAGADPDGLGNFASNMASERPADEYRFQGLLGFGGKYRRRTNTVDCYPEDLTEERGAVIRVTHTALHQLDHLIKP